MVELESHVDLCESVELSKVKIGPPLATYRVTSEKHESFPVDRRPRPWTRSRAQRPIIPLGFEFG